MAEKKKGGILYIIKVKMQDILVEKSLMIVIVLNFNFICFYLRFIF